MYFQRLMIILTLGPTSHSLASQATGSLFSLSLLHICENWRLAQKDEVGCCRAKEDVAFCMYRSWLKSEKNVQFRGASIAKINVF